MTNDIRNKPSIWKCIQYNKRKKMHANYIIHLIITILFNITKLHELYLRKRKQQHYTFETFGKFF